MKYSNTILFALHKDTNNLNFSLEAWQEITANAVEKLEIEIRCS